MAAGNNVDGLKNTTLSNGSNVTHGLIGGNSNDATITNSSYYPSLEKLQNSLDTVFFDSDYIEFKDISNVRSVFVVRKKPLQQKLGNFL